MALVINTNVASLSAQNSMSKAQMDQNEAMERLTTGKRINTAADDAAGLAIANKMTSQVNGLNQAVRNANDGISMLQTAAGGLEESSNILQRMRELAVQSASGTYDDGNRASMNAEVEQLKAELDRISETTTFNGQNILDGSQQNTSLQIGANANETIDFSIGSTAAKELGGSSVDIVGGETNAGATTLLADLTGGSLAGDGADDMFINGQSVGDLTTANLTAGSLKDVLDEMNNNVNGVEIGAQVEFSARTAGDGVFQGDEGLFIEVTAQDADIADINTAMETIRIQNTSSMEELVQKINDEGRGLVEASIDDDGKLNIVGADAQRIRITASLDVTAAAPAGDAALGVAAVGMSTADAGASTEQAVLTLTADAGVDEITVTYGTNGSQAANTGLNTQRGKDELTGNAAPNGAAAAGTIDEGDITLNGVALGAYDPAVDYSGDTTAGDEADMVAWINSHSAETGVVASLDDTDDPGTTYVIKLQSLEGESISIDYAEKLTDAEVTAIEGAWGFQETNASKGATGSVAGIDISTAAGAQKAIETLDKAIDEVSAIQGELGAVNNRLDFTVSNLSNVSENASAAKSRIEDADFAAESANLSRAQVLQQASQAMLAQANSAPKQVMSLLQ